jgi:hypothetical protein
VLLRDFGPYVIMFMNGCAIITVAMILCSFGVKGFWALWDNITTVSRVMLLKEALSLCTMLCRSSALKQKNVH